MLSANVSAFSIRKAVGGGGSVPYVLEMFVISGGGAGGESVFASGGGCLLYTSPSPRDRG